MRQDFLCKPSSYPSFTDKPRITLLSGTTLSTGTGRKRCRVTGGEMPRGPLEGHKRGAVAETTHPEFQHVLFLTSGTKRSLSAGFTANRNRASSSLPCGPTTKCWPILLSSHRCLKRGHTSFAPPSIPVAGMLMWQAELQQPSWTMRTAEEVRRSPYPPRPFCILLMQEKQRLSCLSLYWAEFSVTLDFNPDTDI